MVVSNEFYINHTSLVLLMPSPKGTLPTYLLMPATSHLFFTNLNTQVINLFLTQEPVDSNVQMHQIAYALHEPILP